MAKKRVEDKLNLGMDILDRANTGVLPEQPREVVAQPQPAKPTKQVAVEAGLSEKDAKKAVKKIESPKKLKRATKNIEKDPEGSSISDKFAAAFTAFLPQIAGGLVGAAIGGSEGFVGGAELGGSIVNEQRKLDEELALSQAKREQLANADELTPAEERRLNQADENISLRKQQIALLEKGEGRRGKGFEHRVGKEFEQKQQRLDLSIDKSAQFDPAQQTKQAGANIIRKSLTRIDDLFNIRDPKTGIVEGRFNNLASMFGKDRPRFDRLRVETEANIAEYLRSVSGATVSEQEREFLRAVVPNTLDAAPRFEAKLREFRKIVVRQQTEQLKSIIDTQPLRAEIASRALEQLMEEERTFSKTIRNKIGPKKSVNLRPDLSPEMRARVEERKKQLRGK